MSLLSGFLVLLNFLNFRVTGGSAFYDFSGILEKLWVSLEEGFWVCAGLIVVLIIQEPCACYGLVDSRCKL